MNVVNKGLIWKWYDFRTKSYNKEKKMLYIQEGSEFGKGKPVKEWHVGEPIPHGILATVVLFQADGDELELILRAMEGSTMKQREAAGSLYHADMPVAPAKEVEEGCSKALTGAQDAWMRYKHVPGDGT